MNLASFNHSALVLFPRQLGHRREAVYSTVNTLFVRTELDMFAWCVCVGVCWLLSQNGLFEIPWTIASQTLLSMEFSRQEYWSGLPFPSPGIKPGSPALQAVSLPLSHQYRTLYTSQCGDKRAGKGYRLSG